MRASPTSRVSGHQDEVVQDHATGQPDSGVDEVRQVFLEEQPGAVRRGCDPEGAQHDPGQQSRSHAWTSSRLTHLVCSTPGRLGAISRQG